MNPEPRHHVKEHVEYDGRCWVITDRAPNADGWRLTLHPADLAGPEVRVSDDDARVRTLPPAARSVLQGAGLDVAVFDEELERAGSPLDELLRTVAAVLHAGPHRIPDMRSAYIRYQEQGA